MLFTNWPEQIRGYYVNCPSVVWSRDSNNYDVLFPSYCNIDSAQEMFSRLLNNDRSQVNFAKNYQNILLDLIFVSDSAQALLSECGCPFLPVDSYHIPVELRLDMCARSNLVKVLTKVFNLKRANFCGIKNYLASVNWNLML